MNKRHLLLLAIPIIALAALFQFTFDQGEQGRLDSVFLREKIYPMARSINGTMTNIKFRLRGPVAPKNKIVIVDADEDSINIIGRWPWHRDVYAEIVYNTLKLGAKSVGLDIAFSEPEIRIPPEVYELVSKTPKMAEQIKQFDSGDEMFGQVVERFKDRVILGFSHSAACQPRYSVPEDCPIFEKELNQEIEKELYKFALQDESPIKKEDLKNSPLQNMLRVFTNIPALRDHARYSGFFTADPDADGYIRRYPLFLFHHQKAFPALALRAAAIAKNDEIKIEYTNEGLIKKVYFAKEPEKPIHVTPLGYVDMNFRGPSRTFTYISVVDLMRGIESGDPKIKEMIQDATVFFGVSAIGLFDMRAFPFDSNTPGVEGHATAADSILSGDELRSASSIQMPWLPMALLISLGLLFGYFFAGMGAIPSLLIFTGFAVGAGVFDVKVLFGKYDINLPTSFLLIEISMIFTLILSIRYVLEEKNKKFIKGAFSKYLAPAVVDFVLKNPSALTVGGERKELTILFSDLRGFTTFSEKMDPKTLSQFLNEYLSEMTEVIFQHQGTLDKYIGDAIMAFWGAPLDQPDHAERAWKAAIAMQQRLKEITPGFKQKYGIDVSIGVGIHSGVVSVGNMGSKRIFAYTVIGDHVNLSSRLESLTRQYGAEILTTQDTLSAIPESERQKNHARAIDSVIVKGKTKPVDLIQVSSQPFDAKLLEEFNLALKEFRSRLWDQAIARFQTVNEGFKKLYGDVDTVSEMFIERCEEYKKDPPDENWDGTIQMRKK